MTKKQTILLVVFYLMIQNKIQAQPYSWNQKANFGGGNRAGSMSFSIGTDGYFTSGLNQSLNAFNDLWKYDLLSNTWTQVASIPGPTRYSGNAFTINNLGYVCLGWQSTTGPALADLWQYNPALNSWIQKANFIGTGRYTAASFVVNNKAYVGTGYAPLSSSFYEYDPVTDTWTSLINTFPGTARQSAIAFSITYTVLGVTYEKGYLCTGSLNNTGTNCANDLWEFTPGATPGSGTWLQKTNFPGTNRYAAFAFTIADKAFVGGGVKNSVSGFTYFSDFSQYDPVTDAWTSLPNYPGLNIVHPATCTIGNIALVGTGQVSGSGYSNQLWEYAPLGVAPSVSMAVSDSSFCEKNCLDFFDLSTNNPTAWQWFFPGADSTSSNVQNPSGICYNTLGSFDVTLIACNQFGCDTITISNFINEYANPTDSIWTANDTMYSLPANNYQWYELTGGLISGATSQYYVPLQPQSGSYYCVVTDSIGCVATSNLIVITASPPAPEGGVFAVTPNPTDGNFEISFGYNSPFGSQGAVFIYDAIGKLVFNSSLTTHHSLLTTSLRDGIYIVEVMVGDKIYRKKMVVKK